MDNQFPFIFAKRALLLFQKIVVIAIKWAHVKKAHVFQLSKLSFKIKVKENLKYKPTNQNQPTNQRDEEEKNSRTGTTKQVKTIIKRV